MNITARFNQLQNYLHKSTKVRNWALIYGVPRSGTSYILQEFLKLSKQGCGDWEIPSILKTYDNLCSKQHIQLDEYRLKQGLLDTLLFSMPPGSGNQFDCTIKQINLSANDYHRLCELFGSEPAIKVFVFRHPQSWLTSAKKKFQLDDQQAWELYLSASDDRERIGGQSLEYNANLLERMAEVLKVDESNFSPFRLSDSDSGKSIDIPSQVIERYQHLAQSI